MFLVRFTTDVTLTFFHAWLKTFPTFPSYPTSASTNISRPLEHASRRAPRSQTRSARLRNGGNWYATERHPRAAMRGSFIPLTCHPQATDGPFLRAMDIGNQAGTATALLRNVSLYRPRLLREYVYLARPDHHRN
jgi:hypothetical protein